MSLKQSGNWLCALITFGLAGCAAGTDGTQASGLGKGSPKPLESADPDSGGSDDGGNCLTYDDPATPQDDTCTGSSEPDLEVWDCYVDENGEELCELVPSPNDDTILCSIDEESGEEVCEEELENWYCWDDASGERVCELVEFVDEDGDGEPDDGERPADPESCFLDDGTEISSYASYTQVGDLLCHCEHNEEGEFHAECVSVADCVTVEGEPCLAASE